MNESFYPKYFLLVIVLVSLIHVNASSLYGDKHVKTATKAIVRYQQGESCKHGETKEHCQKFAFGEKEYQVRRGDRIFYSFNTTEHKGYEESEVPVFVSGKIVAIFLEALDEPDYQHYWASAIFINDEPQYQSLQYWAQEEKYFRIDLSHSERHKLKDYSWVEATVLGTDPHIEHYQSPYAQKNSTMLQGNSSEQNSSSQHIKNEL